MAQKGERESKHTPCNGTGSEHKHLRVWRVQTCRCSGRRLASARSSRHPSALPPLASYGLYGCLGGACQSSTLFVSLLSGQRWGPWLGFVRCCSPSSLHPGLAHFLSLNMQATQEHLGGGCIWLCLRAGRQRFS